MAAVAVAVLCQFAASSGRSARRPADATPETDAPLEPLRSALAGALRRPRLWLWLLAAATCTLLDEIVVALATIRAERDLGTPAALAAGIAVLFAGGSVAGSTLGARAVERLGSRRVLLLSAAACAISLVWLVGCRGAFTLGLALAVVGVTCAPHHALALARAYDEVPRRPGVVQACAQLFVVVDVAAPLGLGWMADRFGARAALACLVVQPGVIVACAACLAPPRLRRADREGVAHLGEGPRP
jgi:fucose permease